MTAVKSASCIFQPFGRTEQSLTTANSSKENGIVERANQEVLRHLNAILFDSLFMTSGHSSSYPGAKGNVSTGYDQTGSLDTL